MGKDDNKDVDIERSIQVNTFMAGISLLVIIGAVFIAGAEFGDTQWECTQTECVESQQAAQAWVQQNCVVRADDNNTPVCQITSNGQRQMVPLEQINTSNIYQCTKSVCTQQILVKNTTGDSKEYEEHQDYFYQERPDIVQ